MKRLIRTIPLCAALVLTARLGRVQYGGHTETWYNLNMSRVVINAHNNGIDGAYWIRDDGCKMLDSFVMCAGHPDRYGEVVETSRGLGLIVDACEKSLKEPDLIDLAVAW